MKIEKTAKISGTNIMLSELRALVEASKEADGTEDVDIREFKSLSQFDWNEASIAVTWAVDSPG